MSDKEKSKPYVCDGRALPPWISLMFEMELQHDIKAHKAYEAAKPKLESKALEGVVVFLGTGGDTSSADFKDMFTNPDKYKELKQGDKDGE